ncbi:hypothetical protein HK097_006933 [Rhizophlyctis rosea]|uniref:RAD50-interacting protein 1 n=1 Tax=Rhizophlyctis rosea TaxID=64517 RepID=A0AAD5SK44_9FUNG|nr:hypothetical protein HK097_006933 [Rhizophlyctis rosea]
MQRNDCATNLNALLPELSSLSFTLQPFLSSKIAEKAVLAEKVRLLDEQVPIRVRDAIAEANNVRTTLQRLRTTRSHLQQKLIERDASEHYQQTLAYLCSTQEKLRRLQAAREYVGLLLKVDELSNLVKERLDSNPKAAMTPYNQLRQLAVPSHAKEMDEGEHHLAIGSNLQHFRTYMKDTLNQCHADLSTKLSKKLELALDSLGWPNVINASSKTADQLHAFREAFFEMLSLEAPTFPDADNTLVPETILAPIDVMLRLPTLHFKYHFMGTKPTNRLDKPEWAFTKVLALLRDHTPFLCGPVQSILNDLHYDEHDAKNEFTRGLLTVVTQRLRLDAPKLLAEPQLLSHAIGETLLFDKAIREVHLYVPRAGTEWKGCIDVFTENAEWFRAWLAVELEAAKIRFEDIVKAEDAWDLAYGTMGDVDDAKLTKCAEAFVILLEAVTEQYQLLPNFPHRMAFFSEIQLALLEDFLQEVRNGVEEHISTSIPSIVASELSSKGSGIQSLCRYMTSLEHISSTLREWGEETFFLTMWDDLQKRQAEPDANGMIFDEVVSAYETLRSRIEKLIVEEVHQIFADKSWEYDRKRNWTKLVTAIPTDTKLADISPEICEALEGLSYILPAIADHLPASMFQNILRTIAGKVDDHLFERVVLRGEFNEQGGVQFRTDMVSGLWGGVLRKWTRKPENLFRRTKEATILLTLPAMSHNSSAVLMTGATSSSVQWSLSLVGTVIFGDDPKRIEKVLDDIGISKLSLEEVKKVLQRRVEMRTLWDG